MAKNDVPTWTIGGIFIGMVTSTLVNPSYTLLGALLGGFIGYMLAQGVK